MTAAAGHTDPTPDRLNLVQAELRAALERLPERRTALARAGAGVPVAFGRAVRAAGRELVLVTLTQGLVPALLPARDRVAPGELVSLAWQVRLLAYDLAVRDACVGADERIIAQCRQLLAVWAGSPSNGRDATAHLVAYARAHGVPVEVVWPQRAARGAIPGQPARDAGRRPRGSRYLSATVGPEPTPTTGKAEHPR
ncbi:hypothetical protein AV521_39730 [Streptomyces sp. IMTB 2501]|uniref:hypothetical protein n=1 Tax=Streptomyces sp. IMTB 2501 TaxID=1776340 RepID=UPI00096F44D2|nr:hypothetical protein [Streptomyces sp. IMTB 2501]OLZ63135.1 hypothetical protein AV521_39730 [Streptomyces sp. IMTB 2501]